MAGLVNGFILPFALSIMLVAGRRLPILKQYNFTATVFVPVGYIGLNNDWNHKDKFLRKHLSLDQLKRLNNNNWEIASHGVLHKSYLKLSTEELLHELEYSKARLEEEFGLIDSFAFPYGDTNDYITMLASKHYKNLFNTSVGGTNIILDRSRIKRYTIDEIKKYIDYLNS